jgi:hypothetical protein
MRKKRDASVLLVEALQKIEAEFRGLPLFSRPRSEALYHYVAALEAEGLGESLLPLDARKLGFHVHRRAVESSCVAVPAMFDYCRPDSGNDIQFDRATFLEARDLHEFAYRYEQIKFSNRLAEKGLFSIHAAQRDPRITFCYASEAADEVGTLRKARELHELFSAERLTVDRAEIEAASNELTAQLSGHVKRVEPEACEFQFAEALFPIIRNLGRALVKTVPHDMASDVAVGSLSFSDLREFWGALLALSSAYQWATDIAAEHDIWKFPIRSAVLRLPTERASEIIAGVINLPMQEVERLVRCYTYDIRIAGSVPIVQPLLPVGYGTVCFPFSLIHGNNFERNFFKLLQRHPALLPFRCDVENRKEPIAIEQLRSMFPAPKYKTKGCLVIPGLTDADLVVYEVETGFVLVIQHKWLLEPDSADESEANNEKLRVGARQSVEAIDFSREHRAFLSCTLGLTDSEAMDRIEAVAVCRGGEPNEFLPDQAVPIITEVAFAGLRKSTSTLAELWKALKSRPDKTDAAAKAVEGQFRVELAGYEFVMPGLAIR